MSDQDHIARDLFGEPLRAASKPCRKCGEVKPLVEFTPHNDMRDGYEHTCKACRAKHVRESVATPRVYPPSHHRCCRKCKISKPITEFRFAKKARGGYESRCKECSRGEQLDQRLKKQYNISRSEYDAINESQSGLCASCHRPPRGKGQASTLHVDHNHTTGKTRGLLCTQCNTALGLLDDSIEILLMAAEYLRIHSSEKGSET